MSSTTSEEAMETCARLIFDSSPSLLFVKGSWFPGHFRLYISDALHCWTCDASEKAVAEQAAGWGESASEYLQRAQFYLSHQHSDSTYRFLADGENRKLSWTMEKHGTELEGKWSCKKADQEVTCNILNFLVNSNVKLSDEVLRKTQSFDKMKAEAENYLKQSEQFKNEKQQFETDIFRKFLVVLNSKKSKLRELRDRLAKSEPAEKQSGNEEEDTDSEESDADDSGRGGYAQRGASHGASEHEDASPRLKSAHTDTDEETGPDVDMAKESPQRRSSRLRRSPRRRHRSDAGPSAAPSSRAADSAPSLLTDSDDTKAPKRKRALNSAVWG